MGRKKSIPKESIVFNNKIYKRLSGHISKDIAQKRVKEQNKLGNRATVLERKDKFWVYIRKNLRDLKSKSKKKTKKKIYEGRLHIVLTGGYATKVKAKNLEEAQGKIQREHEDYTMDPYVRGYGEIVGKWEDKKFVKRKDNPYFKSEIIERVHPKTGKKYKQKVWKRDFDYRWGDIKKDGKSSYELSDEEKEKWRPRSRF